MDNVASEEIHYWRKHPNLHGWMEQIYRIKGGDTNSDFNGDRVVLNNDDLNTLEEDLMEGNLPKTGGFFFGESDGTEIDDDLLFVSEAKQAIKEGYTVYYTSWW